MISRRIHLTFPKERVTEPIIYYVGKEFNVVTNIRRANVDPESGWVDLELSGEEDDVQKAIEGLLAKGLIVSPIERDVVE